jgi:dTDP-4-dehydrorhamnose reductase
MLAELATRGMAGTWHTSGAEVVDRVTFGQRLCERFGFDPALIIPSRMADVNLPSPRPAKSGLVVSRTADALTAKPLALDASLARFHAEVTGSAS